MDSRALRFLVVFCVYGIGAVAFLGCRAENVAGQGYTYAKIDRDGYLIPINEILVDEIDDDYDELPGNTLEIRLSDFFLRYLGSFDISDLFLSNSDVVVFARTTIRDPGKSEGFTYQTVLLNNQDNATNQSAAQGSGNSLRDVPILPAILYENQDISISIRVIELDQKQNQKLGDLVSAAAKSASTFQPEAAAGISVFETVLNFLIANNPDDIEFAVDIGMSQGGNARINSMVSDNALPSGSTRPKSLVLEPRTSSIAILKTEDPTRTVFPDSEIDLIPHGMLWGLATISKILTLDFMETTSSVRDGDWYFRSFGNPLRVTTESLSIPKEIRASNQPQRTIILDWVPTLELFEAEWMVTAILKAAYSQIFSRGQIITPAPIKYSPAVGLQYRGGTYLDPASEQIDLSQNSSFFPHRSKSYVILTLSSPPKGLQVTAKNLQDLSDDISSLEIRTADLSPIEFRTELEKVEKSLVNYAASRNFKNAMQNALADAQTPEEIQKAKNDIENQIKQFYSSQKLDVPSNLNNAIGKMANQALKKAKEKESAMNFGYELYSTKKESFLVETLTFEALPADKDQIEFDLVSTRGQMKKEDGYVYNLFEFDGESWKSQGGMEEIDFPVSTNSSRILTFAVKGLSNGKKYQLAIRKKKEPDFIVKHTFEILQKAVSSGEVSYKSWPNLGLIGRKVVFSLPFVQYFHSLELQITAVDSQSNSESFTLLTDDVTIVMSNDSPTTFIQMTFPLNKVPKDFRDNEDTKFQLEIERKGTLRPLLVTMSPSPASPAPDPVPLTSNQVPPTPDSIPPDPAADPNGVTESIVEPNGV